MRALSDALPTGHQSMANPTLQLHFCCEKATPPVSHSHNWPPGRMQFLFKIGQKKLFFANKDPQTNFDAWMILQKPVLSFKCNDFFKNDQFEGDIIFCHLNPWSGTRVHWSLVSMYLCRYWWMCQRPLSKFRNMHRLCQWIQLRMHGWVRRHRLWDR